jgi:hypothetical protein
MELPAVHAAIDADAVVVDASELPEFDIFELLPTTVI